LGIRQKKKGSDRVWREKGKKKKRETNYRGTKMAQSKRLRIAKVGQQSKSKDGKGSKKINKKKGRKKKKDRKNPVFRWDKEGLIVTRLLPSGKGKEGGAKEEGGVKGVVEGKMRSKKVEISQQS